MQFRPQMEFVWLYESGVVCHVVHHYLWCHRKSGGCPRTAHGCGVNRPSRGVRCLGDGIPVVWRALPHCCQVHKDTDWPTVITMPTLYPYTSILSCKVYIKKSRARWMASVCHDMMIFQRTAHWHTIQYQSSDFRWILMIIHKKHRYSIYMIIVIVTILSGRGYGWFFILLT